MFKKQISNLEFFKKFTKSTGYDLYEICFESDDEHLNKREERLALFTEIQLTSTCTSTTVYSSLHQATIKLKLIKRDLQPTTSELVAIGEFTQAMFRIAIPVLKKRTDLKFNLEECLFKFAFLGDRNSIDYDQMAKLVQTNEDELDEERLLKQGNGLLVRALHTNTDYKLISTKTCIYPKDKFDFNGRQISFIDYYKREYDLMIDAHSELYQVEKAGLNSPYSIYVEQETANTKSSRFNIYLPKEVIVVLPATKTLYTKLNCLLPFIYRTKQKLILGSLSKSLNKKVLNIEHGQDFEDVFSSTKTYRNNIDEYINEMDKQVQKPKSPYATSDSDCDTTMGDYDTAIEDNDQMNETYDGVQVQANGKTKEKIVQKPARKRTGELIFNDKENLTHPPIKQAILILYMNEALDRTLNEEDFGNLDEFICQFKDIYEVILKQMNQQLELKDYKETKSSNTDCKMIESEDLKKMNFDIWNTENSNSSVTTTLTLLEASTTKSADDCISLERLEFLGDCFLKLTTCCLLFHLYPDLTVGELDILKTKAVSNKSLYCISRRNNLPQYLMAANFLPGVNWLPSGFSYEGSTPNCPTKQVTTVDENGFRRLDLNLVDKDKYQELKPKTIADGIEGLVGGVLVASGIKNACLFMKSLGIYSDEFVLDQNSSQKDWFKKYDPLEHDPLGNLKKFMNEMYMKYNFKHLEYQIGYEFKNKALLVQAFKHVSHQDLKEFPSYERLEFLGDAVIDYLIARYFFEDKGQKFTPGELTHFKQSLINNEFFGTVSIKYELDSYLLYRDRTLFSIISRFKDDYNTMIRPKGDILIVPGSYMMPDDPTSINFDVDFEIPKVLGDIFESLIGAIFIDSGDFSLNTVWSVLHKFMIKELKAFRNKPPKSFLGHMHELYPNSKFWYVALKAHFS